MSGRSVGISSAVTRGRNTIPSKSYKRSKLRKAAELKPPGWYSPPIQCIRCALFSQSGAGEPLAFAFAKQGQVASAPSEYNSLRTDSMDSSGSGGSADTSKRSSKSLGIGATKAPSPKVTASAAYSQPSAPRNSAPAVLLEPGGCTT